MIELSRDGRVWRTALDRSVNGADAWHDYEVPKAEHARFVRLRNVHSPDGGEFSLSDLRVFGRPAALNSAVRRGVRPDLMNQNYQVYDGRRQSL